MAFRLHQRGPQEEELRFQCTQNTPVSVKRGRSLSTTYLGLSTNSGASIATCIAAAAAAIAACIAATAAAVAATATANVATRRHSRRRSRRRIRGRGSRLLSGRL